MAEILLPTQPVAQNESSIGPQDTPREYESNQETGGIGKTEVPPRPNANDDTTKNPKDSYEQWRTVVAALALFVASCALSVSIFSCNSSRRAVDIAEQTLTKVQRAFVTLKDMQAYATRDTQGHVTAWIFQGTWENSGATNTQIFRQYANCAWGNKSPPDNYDFPDMGHENTTEAFIAAKDTAATALMPVPPDVMLDVQEGKQYLYFWGWAAYRDVFQNSNPHLTEYCFRVTIVQGDVMKSEAMKFIYTQCPSHNCADESCKDYDQTEKKLKGN